MKNYFLVIVLGLFLVFIFASTMFNYNLISNMLNKQDLIQSNVDNLKRESEIVAYNLGELIDVSAPVSLENNQESESISSQNQNMPVMNENLDFMMMGEMNTQNEEFQNIKMQNEDLHKNDKQLEMISSILNKAPSIELKGVNGSMAIGKAAMAVYGNKTYLKIAAINMPNLPINHEYKAWLVNDDKTNDKIPAGIINFEASTSNATLFFVTDGDKSDYKKVAITLDSKENISPQTSFSIIEGRFEDSVDFNVDLKTSNSMQTGSSNKNMNSLSGNQNLNDLLEVLKNGSQSPTLDDSGFDMASVSNMNIQDLLQKLGK